MARGAYVLDLDLIPYRDAWDLQRSLAAAVSQGAVPDTVVFLEHPPVVTLGRRTDQATKYLFRQDPGAENSMGTVRINMPNPNSTYMHDTPNKNLFGQDFRFHSSGCVRIQNIREILVWLLKDNPGWDRARVEQAQRSGERTDVKLSKPVPVYWVYITAWATPDGVVHFRPDIYNHDGVGQMTAAVTPVSAGGMGATGAVPSGPPATTASVGGPVRLLPR